MVFPPFVKGAVRAYVESLLWQGCLGERVADVGPKNKEVFGGQDCVKEARAGLADTVGIDFIKNFK
jgi:hypothetical protein